jgi:hypothetical protein
MRIGPLGATRKQGGPLFPAGGEGRVNGISFDAERPAPWKDGWIETDINLGVDGLGHNEERFKPVALGGCPQAHHTVHQLPWCREEFRSNDKPQPLRYLPISK